MPLHPFLVNTSLFKPLRRIFKPFHLAYKYVDYLAFVKKNKGKGHINDYYFKKAQYKNRFQLHDALLEDLKDVSINYYEFGVAGGDMIRYWSEKNRHQQSIFVGFDSFEGLPESWEEKKTGHFNQKGNFPAIDDPRVKFVKGWFQNTVYNALLQGTFEGQSVFHLDADLFSSTLYVLFQIHAKLKKNDILIFDEFSSHLHEFEAFEIFKKCCGRDWEFVFLGAVNNYRQVAFQLK